MSHQTTSFIKSFVRILGYLLFFYNVKVAALVLVASEGVGIIEEFGER